MPRNSLSRALKCAVEPISQTKSADYPLPVSSPSMPRIIVVDRPAPAPAALPFYISRTVVALQHVRRMRGGSQPQLMRCSDGGYYVVKFQNNPQGTRILANELLAAHLADWLHLPVPQAAVVEVSVELIEGTEGLVIELGRGRIAFQSGKCFGSRHVSQPCIPHEFSVPTVLDFMPGELLRRITNLADFAGMLVFDQWTCNTDGRQAIFVQVNDSSNYKVFMIDNGFCFNATEWSFPDGPLRGIYARTIVYDGIKGFDAFEPWLDRLEHGNDAVTLAVAASHVPTEWYGADHDGLARMLNRLDRRRHLVRELLWSTWKAKRASFKNWHS